MEPKFKTQKNPKIFQRNPKKSQVKKLTPKKSHADFVAIPERDNAITQRKTLEVERSNPQVTSERNKKFAYSKRNSSYGEGEANRLN